MLLLTCKQFQMNFTEVDLQGGHSTFQDGCHQLLVFISIRLLHVA